MIQSNSMSEPMLVQNSSLVLTSDRTVNDWTVQVCFSAARKV